MSKPRACYTYALSGKSTPGGVKFARPAAYRGCATGALPESADFALLTKTQPQIFQYVMFGQTNAFKHEQEQAIINAFYGVKNPADPKECRLKRPRRTEDPTDGTHCLVNKTMQQNLVGKALKFVRLHFCSGCPQWERRGPQRFATFWGHASNTPPQNSKSGCGGGKRMRRLADRHRGTIIYLQHRETALIGAVWTETKYPIGAIETGSVGQNVL
ncbi:MAG: hypothetical protein USCAAHI_00655 [Beijerinckiaceae bacterium]|nr:MAG: hypothetical protein USCAAHI_00655 [Beijerinckiaceae bacterium]